MAIHPTAIIDPHAELDSSVEVGAYSIIGPDVRIGARTRIGPHVVIEGHTTIGEDNHIFQFASLGGVPQDKKYAGELTKLEIGDRNAIVGNSAHSIWEPFRTKVSPVWGMTTGSWRMCIWLTIARSEAIRFLPTVRSWLVMSISATGLFWEDLR